MFVNESKCLVLELGNGRRINLKSTFSTPDDHLSGAAQLYAKCDLFIRTRRNHGASRQRDSEWYVHVLYYLLFMVIVIGLVTVMFSYLL